MDTSILKLNEGKKVTVILNNNNVYSNIIYEFTNEGSIKFKDNHSGQDCFVLSSFIAVMRNE